MSARIDVSTSAMHLATAPKNPLGSVVYMAIMSAEKITENVVKSIITGASAKMSQAYRYARDTYELKLPSGTTAQANILTTEELSDLISVNIHAIHGVICSDSGYDEYSDKIKVIQFLCLDRGYSSATNIVLNYPGYTDTNLFKITLRSVVLDPDGLHATVTYNVYNKRITTIYSEWADPVITEDWVLDYVTTQIGVDQNDQPIYETTYPEHYESVPVEKVYSLPNYTPCFYAIYQKINSLGQTLPTRHTWLYDMTSGLYPEIEEPTTKFKSDTYFPVIPIRYNNVDLTDPSLANTTLYQTSKRLLKIANIPFEYLGKQINENPDVAEIDHAYVMFGVDIQTEQSESLHYLNLFFDHVHNQNAYSNYKISRSDNISFLEYGLNLKVSYDSITSTVLEGMSNVRVLGTTTKAISLGLTDSLILETKISPTLMRRVVVTNLVITNDIYQGRSIITDIRTIASNKKDHNLIIPIQYNISQAMPAMQRNALYTDATMLVINTVKITHLKWYEESWFKFVVIIIMVIVLVVVTILSWGSITTWWLALMALIEGGLYAAAIIFVLIPLVIMILTTLVLRVAARWLVTTIGAEAAAIAAVIISCAAVISGSYADSMELLSQFVLNIAQTVIQFAQVLISTAKEFLLKAGQQLIAEYKAFEDQLTDAKAELAVGEDMLKLKGDIDPCYYITPSRLKVVYESPTAMIQRCLGIVENTIYLTEKEIPNFIDRLLTLPRTIKYDPYAINS